MPDDQSAAGSAVGSAGQAVGSTGTAVREQGDLGVGQHFNFTHDSVPTCVEARASAVGAKRILPQANWVSVFESLSRSVERIGHVGVDAGDSVLSAASAHATGDSFVISEGLLGARVIVSRIIVSRIRAADGEVVHGSGGSGGDAVGNRLRQRFQKYVDNSLRSLNVASSDGGGRLCVDHGSRWRDYTDGAHEAGGGGHVLAEQAAEDVEAGRVGDGLYRVDRALDLRVAAGEVDGDVGRGLLATRCGRKRGKPRLYCGFLLGG